MPCCSWFPPVPSYATGYAKDRPRNRQIRVPLDNRLVLLFVKLDVIVAWDVADDFSTNLSGESPDNVLLIIDVAPVQDQTTQTGVIAVSETIYRCLNVARGKQRHFLARCHDNNLVGIAFSHGHGKPAAHNITEHIEEDEIRAILTHSGKTGGLSEEESKMLDRVFEFHDLEAHQIIVPRPDIVFLSTESDAMENLEVAEKCGFTRFPLCEENIDQVVGFVHVKDLYGAVRRNNGPVSMIDLKREIIFFPEHTPLDHVLREFQGKKVHLGIVIDEYGGTLGMLTLEDVIEELVGEIQDEFDKELPPVRRVGANEFVFDGSCPVSLFEETTGIELPETGADTVAGIVLDTSGDLPSPGEQIPIEGGVLVVEQVVEQRIVKIRLMRDRAKPQAAG